MKTFTLAKTLLLALCIMAANAVMAQPTVLQYNSPQIGTVGHAISISPTESQPTDVTYTINPTLPSGLNLNADGSISGTPNSVTYAASYVVVQLLKVAGIWTPINQAFINISIVEGPSVSSFSPTSAGSGATVTITGTDLTGATAVSFGGTAATSFTVVNSTTITAVVGAGTTGDVVVTTPQGNATLAGFTYMPAPVVSSFTPTITGTGTTVTITGTDFTGATEVSFGGTAASSFTVVNSTTITAVVGAGATGDVVVTTPVGTGTLAGFTYCTPMAAPVVTLTQPSCLVPTGKIKVKAVMGFDYSIDGTTFKTIPTWTPLKDGVYTITTRNTSTGCTKNTNVTLIRFAGAPADFVTAGGGPRCSYEGGVPVTLSGSETGVKYTLVKDIFRTATEIAGTTQPLTFSNVTVGGIYKVIATNVSTSCWITMSNSATVVVNQRPATPAGTGATVCRGTTATISAIAGTGETINWYTTATGGTAVVGSSYTTPVLTATKSYYAAAVNNTTGCASVRRAVAAKVITVPAAPKTITASNQIACGGSGGVGYSFPPVAGATSYSWSWTPAANILVAVAQTQTGTIGPVLIFRSYTGFAMGISASNACGSSPVKTVQFPCMIPSSRPITQAAEIVAERAEGARISPNPAKGHFNLQLNGYKAGKALLQLCTMNGTVMQTKTVETSGSMTQVPFDVQKEMKGMYLLRIISAEKTEVVRVVVM